MIVNMKMRPARGSRWGQLRLTLMTLLGLLVSGGFGCGSASPGEEVGQSPGGSASGVVEQQVKPPPREAPRSVQAEADRVLQPPASLVTTQPGGQELWWSFEEAKTFTRVGPNASITIDQGKMDYVSFCPKGKSDFFVPWTDIYVVPSGSVTVGDTLSDVAGAPNTVQGGLFIREQIGLTAPSGQIVSGTYDVVYDECQDGLLDEGDALFHPAFEVFIPANVPPLPAFTRLKADANAQADYWWIQWKEYELFFKLLQQAEKQLGKAHPGYKLYLSFRKGLFAMAGDPIKLTINHVANTYSHYKGIAADPPDPDFAQLTVLEPREELTPSASDPLQRAFTAGLGTQVRHDDVLTQALLHALERYQGAAEARNGEWALIQAREIQHYARLLAAQTFRTNEALTGLGSALSTDPGELDAAAADMELWRARVVASGFTADEVREARNIGLTEAGLTKLRLELAAESYTLTRESFLAHLAEVQAGHTALAASLGKLAQDMDGVINTLVNDPSFSKRMPVAHAGGPYTGTVGTPVSLDASGSTSPSAIVAADWDLDGDGQFDDAQGLSVAHLFTRPYSGLAGIKVTNREGKSDVAYAHVTVTSTDSAPVLTALQPADLMPLVVVGTPVPFTVNAVEPDGDALTLTWSVDGAPVGNGGGFTYAPPASAVGLHRVDLTAAAGTQHTAAMWTPVVLLPDQDGDGWRANADCDDTAPSSHPGGHEVPGNGKDDDCDPATSDAGKPPRAFFNPSGNRNVASLEDGAAVHSTSAINIHTVRWMLDRSATGQWRTTKENEWATIKLRGSSPYLIDRIALMPGLGNTPATAKERVRTFEVEVSTADDGAFTAVQTTPMAAAPSSELQEFVFTQPVLARYVRYRPLTNQDSKACCITTQQFKVLTGQDGGQTISFQNLSTDPDDDITGWHWNFGDGTTSTEASPTHTFPGPGVYTVTLTARDAGGNAHSFSLTQRVLAPPAISFTVTNPIPTEGLEVRFKDTSTEPDEGTIVSRVWSWGDGSADVETTSLEALHTFKDNGTYRVTLTLIDSQEQQSQLTREILVPNAPPYSAAGPDQTGFVELPLEPTGVTARDVGPIDKATLQCSWNWGDGSSTGPGPCVGDTLNPPHAYQQEGVYIRTFTVIDKDGGQSTDISKATISKRGGNIAYQGSRTVNADEPIVLRARLRDLVTGAGVGGRGVTFTFAGQSLFAVTDASGLAELTWWWAEPGIYPVKVAFAGDVVYTGHRDDDRLVVGAIDENLVSATAALSNTELACDEATTVSLQVMGTPPTPQTVPVDISLVIDVSVSMSEPAGTNETKIAAARRAARTFVRMLDQQSDGLLDGIIRGSRVAVVPFSTTSWVGVPLTSDAILLDQYLNALETVTGTSIHEGIKVGQAELAAGAKPGNKPILILLSDGKSDPIAAKQAADAAKAAGTELFSIGLGDEIDETLLKAVASTEDSHYYPAPSTAQLEQVYANIAGAVTGPSASDVLLTAEVGTGFTLTAGSIQPVPELVNGNRITWRVPVLWGETKTFTYQVRGASGGGTWTAMQNAGVSYLDTRGTSRSIALEPLAARVTCPVTVSYQGDSSGVEGQRALFSARLTDSKTGRALAGQTLAFQLGVLQVTARTGDDGMATAPVTLPTGAGQHTVKTSFAGAPGHLPGETVAPFEVIGGDDAPPVTRIDLVGSKGLEDWWVSAVQVSLTAVDQPGPSGTASGVHRTEYSLDGGNTWTPYAGPFSITSQGPVTVLARSVDNAGNPENPPVRSSLRLDTQAPAIVLGERFEGTEGTPITLDAGSSTDATSGIARIQWDLDGGGAFTTDGPAASKRWADNGTYPVTVKVTDRAGNVATATAQVQVRNVPPVVRGPADQSSYWGLPVELAGQASDPSEADMAAGLLARWDFGDGTAPVTGLVSSHVYAVPGIYTATLEVNDKDGGTGRDSTRVSITRRPSTLTASSNSTVFGYATTLTAQLGDGVDVETASLSGRTVTFSVGGHTMTAVTDAHGRATVSSPPMLMPGTHMLVVTFGEDSHYLASSARAQLVVSNSAGKVTAGTLQTSGSGHGGFNVHSDGMNIKGQFQFQNEALGFHASELTAFGAAPQGRSAWFAGRTRTGEPFVVYVEDNGEPGGKDRFQLWVSGQPHNADGLLSGGNIQVHAG